MGVNVEKKKCGKCGQVKPLIKFYTDKSKKDQLSFKCKECQKKYHEENRAVINGIMYNKNTCPAELKEFVELAILLNHKRKFKKEVKG